MPGRDLKSAQAPRFPELVCVDRLCSSNARSRERCAELLKVYGYHGDRVPLRDIRRDHSRSREEVDEASGVSGCRIESVPEAVREHPPFGTHVLHGRSRYADTNRGVTS